MDQSLFQRDPSPAPTPPEAAAERRDQAQDAPAMSADDAASSRHLYTMTVDDVATELIAYDLHRDTRTIQRWCKRGKLRSIIDHENGDRYLIDPASVRDMVTTLLEERDSRGPRHTSTSRPRHDDAGTAPRRGDDAPTGFRFTPRSMADKQRDAATEEPAAAAAPEASRDEIATLRERIAELEKEKAMLSVDKQVREQMVDYLKENFQQMLDQALERTEQMGQLQAENAQLRALLPRQTGDRPEASHGSRGEDAQQVPGWGEPAPPSSPSSMHSRRPWSAE